MYKRTYSTRWWRAVQPELRATLTSGRRPLIAIILGNRAEHKQGCICWGECHGGSTSCIWLKCFEGVHFKPLCCISGAILTVNGLNQYIVVTAWLSTNYYVAVYCGVTDTNLTMVFLKTPSPRSMEYAYLSLSGLCAFQLWPPCQNSTNTALNISKCIIFQFGRVVSDTNSKCCNSNTDTNKCANWD